MPDSWLSYSEELEEAAEVLWSDKDNGMAIESETQFDGKWHTKKSSAHSRSYILLASLALENVLKGLIIAGNSNLISSGKLDKSLKSHKLLNLAKRVDGLVLSKGDVRILQICQDAIPYWGRYPIPLEYKGLKPIQAVTDKFHTNFRDLHFRLCKWLYEQLKEGWDSSVGPRLTVIHHIRYENEMNEFGE